MCWVPELVRYFQAGLRVATRDSIFILEIFGIIQLGLTYALGATEHDVILRFVRWNIHNILNVFIRVFN